LIALVLGAADGASEAGPWLAGAWVAGGADVFALPQAANRIAAIAAAAPVLIRDMRFSLLVAVARRTEFLHPIASDRVSSLRTRA
jgi:hypothetical protein